MTLDLTRRSLLKFMGGAAVGAVLSPLPWKLLDDASIWTQNWAWIARPPRGPVSWKDTTCTLCPRGCGLRARLIGTSFVSAWPQPGHPAAAGLCPLGLAAAQLRYHPARVRGVAQRDGSRPGAPWRVVDADATVGDLGRRLAQARARGGERPAIAVLDLRPGRALSRQYREFAQRQGGLYAVAPDARQAAAAALGGLLAATGVAPAPAPSRCGALLSLGAPVADGAGSPCLPAEGSRSFHLQVDAAATYSAARADRWLPARPGTEAVLVLALANALVTESAPGSRAAVLAAMPAVGGGTFADVLAGFTPERVADACGVPAADLRAAARELAARQPALVVGVGDPDGGPLGREEESAVWCLNLLLGAPGPDGALGLRPTEDVLFGLPELPAPVGLDAVPDGSLDLLLVDGSFPGAPLAPALLRRKLRGPNARLVVLGPYAGGAAGRLADVVLPTPAPGEWRDDVPTPALAPRSQYAWSPAVAAAPDWALHAADWLVRLEEAAGTPAAAGTGAAGHDAELKRRAALLQAAGLGDLYEARGGNAVAVTTLASPDAVAGVLAQGGIWTAPATLTLADGDLRLPGPHSELAARWQALAGGRGAQAQATTKTAGPLLLMAGGGLAAAAGNVVPPVLNKLYRESELVAGAGRAALNPATARSLHLDDGAHAELATAHGKRRVTVRHDGSLPPGVVRLAGGPDPLALGDPEGPGTEVAELCGGAGQPVWRLTAATLTEVHHARS